MTDRLDVFRNAVSYRERRVRMVDMMCSFLAVLSFVMFSSLA